MELQDWKNDLERRLKLRREISMPIKIQAIIEKRFRFLQNLITSTTTYSEATMTEFQSYKAQWIGNEAQIEAQKKEIKGIIELIKIIDEEIKAEQLTRVFATS